MKQWDIIKGESVCPGSPVEDAISYFHQCGAEVYDTGEFYRYLLRALYVDLNSERLDGLSFLGIAGGLVLSCLYVTQCFHDGGISGTDHYIVVAGKDGQPLADNRLLRTFTPIPWQEFHSKYTTDAWTKECRRTQFFVYETEDEPGSRFLIKRYLYLLTDPPGAKGQYILFSDFYD